MAEVFLAEWDAAARPSNGPGLVALKIPLPQFAAETDLAEAFVRESRLATTLQHENLVQVFDSGRNEGRPYLAMAVVDGPTLAELLAALRHSDRDLPLELAIHINAELLSALDYVHNATDASGAPLGVIHRDVSPGNVLLSSTGDVLLGDFGIARSALDLGRTRTGVIKGKLQYLAPEQVTGSAMDTRTDLYAAALVLFELISGEPYIQGESDLARLRNAESPQYRSVGATLANTVVGAQLDRLLERALARFPEERFASAAVLRQRISSLVPTLERSRCRAELAKLIAEVTPERIITGAAMANAARAGRAIQGKEHSLSQRRRWSLLGAFGIAVACTAAWLATPRSNTPQEAALPVLPARASKLPTAPLGLAARTTVPEPPAPSQQTALIQTEEAPADRALARAKATAHPRRAGDSRTPLPPTSDIPQTGPSMPNDSLVEIDALTRRLANCRLELRHRGILFEDLSAEQRRIFAGTSTMLDAGNVAAAATALDGLEEAIREIAIDSAFVRRKLDRVDGELRAAKMRGLDTRSLEEPLALALQDFMDGRLEMTNRRLNDLVGALTSLGAR
ncbi:MAG: protein kinase [Myxococcota bacterium]|nr:protein kinase [Myxococcota bacterium]